MTGDELFLVGLIFILRVFNYAVSTVRLVMIARNRRWLAASLAIIEAFIFAVVIAEVVQDLENLPNLVAYCLGAAVGSWAGMELESRLVHSYMIINVFANKLGQEITDKLRQSGFGVTTNTGQGKDGEVLTIRSVVDKREVKRVVNVIQGVNPDAFIAAEEVRGIRRGYMGAGKGGRPV